MDIKAYAKINLTLDIMKKRADGYHMLDTVMQRITLFDRLSITPINSGVISLKTNWDFLPCDKRNSAYLAASLFYQETGIQGGVNINLQKWIPSRAGLGGGSADAAAVLCAMNKMYHAGLSQNRLLEMGAKIGADVPFCIIGGTCRCAGIGKEISPVSPMPDCLLVICKPPMGISTARAYAMIDQYPSPEKLYTPAMITALESGDIRDVAKALNNRFDTVMRLGQVNRIKGKMLQCGALGTLMSGSGSAVYGIFEKEDRARHCVGQLQENGQVFLTRPVRV